MENALRYELNKISEITNRIYPINAPQGKKGPYLVYMLRKRRGKNLDGITQDIECNVLLNIFDNTFDEMDLLTRKVEKAVLGFQLSNIGEEGIYISDLTIDETSNVFENELRLYRGIIPFKVSYKEER